jgi:hypothetical protein
MCKSWQCGVWTNECLGLQRKGVSSMLVVLLHMVW